MEVVQFDGAWELKILTSKKVDCLLLSQKFWALTSSLAPSSVLALLRGKLSPVSDWRVGSTHTFGHTSVSMLCSDVPDSIVSEGRHGTLWAAESVVNVYLNIRPMRYSAMQL